MALSLTIIIIFCITFLDNRSAYKGLKAFIMHSKDNCQKCKMFLMGGHVQNKRRLKMINTMEFYSIE